MHCSEDAMLSKALVEVGSAPEMFVRRASVALPLSMEPISPTSTLLNKQSSLARRLITRSHFSDPAHQQVQNEYQYGTDRARDNSGTTYVFEATATSRDYQS